jgi:AraC family transcriptional regulator
LRNHDPPQSACAARINRAIDHIVARLDEPLTLHDVARAAHVSPFHFHRLFRAATGETLNQFITRLRLEKALSLAARRQTSRWTEVALAAGFASLSDFSRCFKQRYGVAPSRFDLAANRARQREALRATVPERSEPLQRNLGNPDRFEVTLRDIPAFSVAYLRVPDSYREGAVPAAARRLVEWAEARGMGDNAWFGYMWDDPEVVALADCRYDVAVQLSRSTASDGMNGMNKTNGTIGRYDFPAMRVAQIDVRGSLELELRALEWLFDRWLPASGYLPADLPCFEAWIGRPYAHGLEHFELFVWLPVVRP